MPLAIIMAFLWAPPAEILGESSRILYFHVPLAWVAVFAFAVSGVLSILFLTSRNETTRVTMDTYAHHSAVLGLIFTLMAVITGSIWARISWGSFWNWDPRQTSIVIVLLIYLAYLSLRAVIPQSNRKGRIGAAYLIIAMAVLPFFVFLVPRIYESLHPDTIINTERTVHLATQMRATLIVSVCAFTALYGRLLFLQGRVSFLAQHIEDLYDE